MARIQTGGSVGHQGEYLSLVSGCAYQKSKFTTKLCKKRSRAFHKGHPKRVQGTEEAQVIFFYRPPTRQDKI